MQTVLALLLLFGGAGIPPILSRWSRPGAALAAAAAMLGALALIVQKGAGAARGEVATTSLPWAPELGLALTLRVDGLSLLFSVLVLGIGALVVLYAAYYFPAGDRLGRFCALLLAFAGSMTGLVLSGNLLLLVFFWELTSLSSFLLIGYWSHKPDARRGARLALAVTGMGGLALLGGVLLLGHAAGSFELADVLAAGPKIRAHPLFEPALILVLVGAFTKSAQFPFHFWLPTAMAAPTPVSAYLHSATMVKAGVFLLARLHPVLSDSELWGLIVGPAGLVTLVGGAYLALVQDDLKGLLAYSTISHLGLIVLLLAFATPSASIAAVFHTMNHATFKASLFMAAGIIDHETGTRDMRVLGGLIRAMPHTGALAIVAAAAMAGVPLLNGFLSKEMFFGEALASELPLFGRWIVPAAATLGGLFAVTYSTRFIHEVFFSGRGEGMPRAPHEPPPWMRVPVAVLAVFCVIVGIAPQAVDEPLLAAASRQVVGGELPPYDIAIWHGLNLPLFMTFIALAGGIALYAFGLRRVRALHARIGPELVGALVAARAGRALARGAARATSLVENGSPKRSIALLVALALAAGALPALSGPWLSFPGRTPASPTGVVLFAAIALSAAATVVLHRQRLAALVTLSAVGAVVALAFVGLAAPDLALTQLLVEIVSILLLLLALHHLPQRPRKETPRGRLAADALLAGASGLGAAALTFALLSRPSRSISGFYLEKSVPEGGGKNVVNVILVDFRAMDTLGEITVLALAAIGVVVLLEGLTPAALEEAVPRARDLSPLVLAVVSEVLLPFALLMAAYLFLRGHNLPGGGFVAGLLTAIALILQYLARGVDWVNRRFRRDFERLALVGVTAALTTGLGAVALGGAFLTMGFEHLHLPLVGDVEVATALLFDLGVFVAVLGATMTILSRLGRLSRGGAREARPFEEESDPWKV